MTLNVNRLNSPIKIHRLAEWINKISNILPVRNSLQQEDTER